MNTYICTNKKEHGGWPLGVVTAANRRQAIKLLDEAFSKRGETTSKEVSYTLIKVATETPNTAIFDY